MQSILRLFDRADAFLARLTPGLVAVAIVLTFAVVAGWTARHPEIFEVQYSAAAAAVGMEPVDPPPHPRGDAGKSASRSLIIGLDPLHGNAGQQLADAPHGARTTTF